MNNVLFFVFIISVAFFFFFFFLFFFFCFFFFFSSRRRHTRSDRDWSSDVCSSDLIFGVPAAMRAVPPVFTRSLAALGVFLYAGVGVWALLQGGNFLEYQALFHEEPGGHHGQHVDRKSVV